MRAACQTAPAKGDALKRSYLPKIEQSCPQHRRHLISNHCRSRIMASLLANDIGKAPRQIWSGLTRGPSAPLSNARACSLHSVTKSPSLCPKGISPSYDAIAATVSRIALTISCRIGLARIHHQRLTSMHSGGDVFGTMNVVGAHSRLKEQSIPWGQSSPRPAACDPANPMQPKLHEPFQSRQHRLGCKPSCIHQLTAGGLCRTPRP